MATDFGPMFAGACHASHLFSGRLLFLLGDAITLPRSQKPESTSEAMHKRAAILTMSWQEEASAPAMLLKTPVLRCNDLTRD